MTDQEMDDVLARTLQDYRLSGSEKQALGELVAELQGDEQQLGRFRRRAFQMAAGAVADPAARRVLEWLEDVAKVLQGKARGAALPGLDAWFSPGDDCPARIAGLFRHARQSADVCVYTITDDRISGAMLDAHARGVKLRVITDGCKSSDPGSDVERLAAAGVAVRPDRREECLMHHKFAIFDGTQLLNGSYNWTRGAAKANKENFVVTNDRRLVALFAQAFESLWDEVGR
jgi:phosphatidylserine/phosphatidylglycerophosphate/cardiolipin synthase-like enzyme